MVFLQDGEQSPGAELQDPAHTSTEMPLSSGGLCSWPSDKSDERQNMAKTQLSGVLGWILAVILLAALGFVIVSMVIKR